MKRKIKMNNLASKDFISIYENDWISNVMGTNDYKHCVLQCCIYNAKNFEIEFEMSDNTNKLRFNIMGFNIKYKYLEIDVELDDSDNLISLVGRFLDKKNSMKLT